MEDILARVAEEPEYAHRLRDAPETVLADLHLSLADLQRLATALGEGAAPMPLCEQRVWMGRWLGLMARAARYGEL